MKPSATRSSLCSNVTSAGNDVPDLDQPAPIGSSSVPICITAAAAPNDNNKSGGTHLKHVDSNKAASTELGSDR
ncbi:hypothetical protein ACLOJK_018885 [Asimina triloba]